jgi:hypothetical protein
MFSKTYGEGSEALTLRITPYTPNQHQLKRQSAREHVAAGHWVGSLSGVAYSLVTMPAGPLVAVIEMSVILLSKYGVQETAADLSREIREQAQCQQP